MNTTRASRAAQRDTSTSTEPVVSVIIPVRNGGRDLAELVEALSAQTLPPERFEVIIGDDGSTDGCTEGLESRFALRVLRGPATNSYAARNRAVSASRAPVLAFCDVDCRPEPTWLERGFGALQEADLVAGRVRFALPSNPSIWSLLDMEFHLDQEDAVRKGKATTANLFVRRPVFDTAEGFDESFASGGDAVFVRSCIAQGAKLAYAPDASVWHPTRDAAGSFLKKVWRIQRANGARDGRPKLLTLSSVPVIGMLRSRRNAGRPIRLDRARLTASACEPTVLDDLRALPVIYLLLPLVARAARFRGWHDQRSRR